MAANATAKVTVKLLDQLTAPANIVRNSLRGIRGDMQALSGARLGLTRRIEELSSRMARLRSQMVSIGATSVVAGYALRKIMQPGTDFETLMTDIRQKGDMSRISVKKLGDEIKALGPKVNRSSTEVAKAVDFLMGMGLDQSKTMGILPAVGKTATAYRAEIEDIAKAGHSALTNLRVPIDQIGKAFDVMAQSGKEGGFELKAMARYMPEISAMAQNIGIKGVRGVAELTAALQVVREASGNEEAAATNFINVLQKMESPETRKKFKKVGIDITKEIEAGQKAGISPIETLSIQTKKALAKKGVRIGDLFEDRQAQIGVLALIQKLDQWREIRDKSVAAEGVVEADYKIRMETFQAVIDRTTAAFQRLAIALGDSLVPALTAIAEKMSALADWTSQLIAAYPNVTAAAAGVAAGLLGLSLAVTTARLAMAGLSVFGLKSIRGLLNHLAPKGAPASPAGAVPKAGGTAAPKLTGTVPSTAAPGSAGTAAPRMMTPAEIAKVAKAMPAPNVLGGSRLAKGGLLGAAVSVIGETLIDTILDKLPSPTMPKGYDPKAEMNLSFFARLERLLGTDAGHAKAKGLTEADFERSRRVQDEFKHDPEGSRGRAMAQRDSVSNASVGGDSRATGAAAGAEVGQGIKDGLAAQQPGIEAAAQAIMARVKQMFAAGVDVPIRPKLEGGGAAMRGVHSDTGF